MIRLIQSLCLNNNRLTFIVKYRIVEIAPPRFLLNFERADFRPVRAWGGGRMVGQTNKQKSPCDLQDFVPFGAAALLPLTPIHNHAK